MMINVAFNFTCFFFLIDFSRHISMNTQIWGNIGLKTCSFLDAVFLSLQYVNMQGTHFPKFI